MTDKPEAEPSAAVNTPPPPIDLDAVRGEGRTAALEYCNEVMQICDLARTPEKAAAFIEAGTPVAAIRKSLLDSRATADAARHVQSQIAPGAQPNRGALAENMKRVIGRGV